MNPALRFGALTVIVALLALTLWGSWAYQQFKQTPLELRDGEVLDVRRGQAIQRVVGELSARGITQLDWRWRVYFRLNPATIKAGEYELRPGLNPQGLLELLASGNVKTYTFTIVEGWGFRRLLEALAEDPVLEREMQMHPDSNQWMADIGLEGQHPEGWFLPETYQFVRGDSDLELLRRAHAAMRSALDEAWSKYTGGPLRSSYELLILASIVEKETAVASERSEVAGVFTRRLLKGWRLETDPTVIYGLGESFDGDIRRKDLRTDTPYNTYTRRGLPPTPIALPGRETLLATAQPSDGTAMFFVADGQGGHVFSDTLAEHQVAVRKMLSTKP